MDLSDIDLNFTGSDEEFKALLDEKVAKGEMSQDVADVFYISFLTQERPPAPTEIGSVSPDSEVVEAVEESNAVNETGLAPAAERTFLEMLAEDNAPPVDQLALQAAAGGLPMATPGEAVTGAFGDLVTLAGEASRRVNPLTSGGASVEDLTAITNLFNAGETSVGGIRDEELLALAEGGNPEAVQEISDRQELSEQSFMESLMDPRTHERLPGQVVRGAAQMVMMPQALSGLAGTGIEYLTGTDLGGQAALQSYDERMEALENALGVSPALNPVETIAESLPGLATPGGVANRFVGLTMDFMVDQSIRELTDNPGEKYETIFDRIGITDNSALAVMTPAMAVGAALLGGALTAKAVDGLIARRAAATRGRAVTLRSIDPDGPKDVLTVESAFDEFIVKTVDEQQGLKNILQRHGIPNFDEIDSLIDTDTGAGLAIRVQEAMRTGTLATGQAQFNSPVAPRTIYNAYYALDGNTRDAVGRYILLKDRMDDLNILFAKGQATPRQLTLVQNQINAIEKAFPIAKDFSDKHNQVTQALRDYAVGSLFSQQHKTQLDATRRNYVSLELSQVDPNASFLRRLEQSQDQRPGLGDKEWFLQNRAIDATKDIDRRIDPIDMLMASAEATLSARMRNDVKLAIIQSLRRAQTNNPGSKKYTIRRVRPNEQITDPRRIVTVYRNGAREEYITSRLTAQLLRFDPHVAKFPALYIPKRIFENAVVGPLSALGNAPLGFSATTAVRDAIAGPVMRTGILKPGTMGDLAMAVPEQLWARVQRGLSEHINSRVLAGRDSWTDLFMTPQAKQRFANNLAQSYTQTLYHQSNIQGGFAASEMIDRIKLADGAFKEFADTLSNNMRAIDNWPTRWTVGGATAFVNGFRAVFSAISEAPRYAALRRTVREGANVQDATVAARSLTGDVTRSGRVFQADGEHLRADTAQSGLLGAINRPAGYGIEMIREGAPFINPMIQGNRQLLRAIIEDPIGFNIRAWQHVGLPVLAAFAWNEMFGREHNDYAMNNRSGRDVVANVYVANPLTNDPSTGFEIPLPHELMIYAAPFTRSLYALARGERTEDMRAAFGAVLQSIVQNNFDIDFPIAGQLMFNAGGIRGPEALLRPQEGVRQIREDNIGVLPENVEEMIRTLFAQVGDTALEVAAATAADPSFATMFNQWRDSGFTGGTMFRNALGLKASNSYHSIPTEVFNARVEGIEQIHQFFDLYYQEKRVNPDGLYRPSSGGKEDKWQDLKDDSPELNPTLSDAPNLLVGPEPIAPPTNPLYPMLADLITTATRTSTVNWTALEQRARGYATITANLRDMNNGHNERIQEWQAMLSGITEPQSDHTAELQRIITENGLDITKYSDRIKLLNYYDVRRQDTIMAMNNVITRAEQMAKDLLASQGMEEEAEVFSIERHMADPYDENPFD